jgi:hypothetical protein
MDQSHLQEAIPGIKSKRLGLDSDKFLNRLNRKIVGVMTGIDELDRKLQGLSGFFAILGEPKACKSTFVLQLALHNAKLGNPVFFIDQENGQQRLSERIMCNLYGESWSSVRKMSELREKYEALSRLPLYMNFGKIEMPDIEACVDEMLRLHPGRRGLVIVDSLQSVARNLSDLRMSVDQWLLDLDAMKLKYDGLLSIGIVCEKRRGTYGEASVDAAKESGRIEYKVEQQLDMRNTGDQIIIECTLNRDGPKGMRVPLQKALKDINNEHSFTFRLEPSQGIFE